MCRLLLLFLTSFIVSNYAMDFRDDYTYYEEGWYKYHVMPETWSQARLRCHFEGAVLASPLDDSMLKTMTKMVQERSGLTFTGISAVYSRGTFASVEGVPIESINATWAPEEPNNAIDKEQCIAMVANGSLADVPCDRPLPYICFKKNKQFLTLTTPCDTQDEEYVLYEETGSCYKVHKRAYSWRLAHMICSAEGGNLVIVNSEKEAEVLRQVIKKHPSIEIKDVGSSYYAAGFSDWEDHSVWMTVQGETLADAGYDRWAVGEPNSVGERCGSITKNATLNDVPCDNVKLPIICEKLPGFPKLFDIQVPAENEYSSHEH